MSTPRNNKGGHGGLGGPRRPGGGPPGRGGDGPGGKPPFGARPQGGRPSFHAAGAERSSGPRAPSETQLRLPREERRPETRAPEAASPRADGGAPRMGARNGPANAPRVQTGDRLGRGREMHGGGQRNAPDAPKGAVWLYGLHAVAAALGNPARRLRRLVLTEEAEATLTDKQPQPWPIPHERLDRARIDHLLGRDAVHQGMALLADPLAPPSLAQALERPGPVIVLDQVNDPRNIGAILRSAAAFGAAAVIMQDRNAPEETGALAKAASGALESVPVLRAVNIARTLIALKAAGCWVVGLDASGAALSGPSLSERRVALVLGSEGEGMRRLTRETCDELAGIGMPRAADMESLNVSAATAIALYEMGRRA